MAGWPLSRLLSHVLVAFTIEADNEAEHRMPHSTTNHGRSAEAPGPWLVSLVMWENCLRYLTDDGITVADLARAARTPTNLDGMRRWGYIRIDPPPPRKPGPRSVLYPTRAGLAAQRVWRQVIADVELRWHGRFGPADVAGLRTSLCALAARLPAGLPDALPILGHGLYTRGRGPGDDQFPGLVTAETAGADGAGSAVDDLPLPALLSRVLVTFAVEFERESATSLAISADVLRVLGDGWTRVRDLPALGGVSKEAVSMASGFLVRNDRAETGPVPAPDRGQRIRLTPSGRRARDRYGPLTAAIEDRWRTRWGDALIAGLRTRLERLAGSADPARPLMLGLEPYPDGWRARVRRPQLLPHYPMVLHRGGYPDGS